MLNYSWENIINKKNTKNNSLPTNSEFEKDYFEIVTSSSFRRLQDKTQVYSLSKNDFVRTRLTHSIEVATIAEIIGGEIWKKLATDEDRRKDFPQNEDGYSPEKTNDVKVILRCASLLHDIGNPPLGHNGEKVIGDYFKKYFESDKGESLGLTEQMKNDLIYFEGNAQALRVINRLHHARGNAGMQLSDTVVSSIIKYPISSTQREKKDCGNYKKHGYFHADEAYFRQIRKNTGFKDGDYNRNPLVYIVEAADDIAYTFADIEDTISMNLISFENIKDIIDNTPSVFANTDYDEILGNDYVNQNPEEKKSRIEKLLSSLRINYINYVVDMFICNYKLIMQGKFFEDLIMIDSSNEHATLFKKLKELMKDYVYAVRDDSLRMINHKKTIESYLSFFVDIVLDDNSEKKAMTEKIPSQYREALEKEKEELDKNSKLSESEKNYLKLLMVTDFISSMTDHYALENFELIS